MDKAQECHEMPVNGNVPLKEIPHKEFWRKDEQFGGKEGE